MSVILTLFLIFNPSREEPIRYRSVMETGYYLAVGIRRGPRDKVSSLWSIFYQI